MTLTDTRLLLPKTVVGVLADVTGDLNNLSGSAGLLVLRGERDGRVGARARRAETLLETGQAVLAAAPLGDGEDARLLVVGGLGDVAAARLVIEPVVGPRTRLSVAVEVADAEPVAGVDRLVAVTGL